MYETLKTKRTWGTLEKSILTGKGIDIGCGPDPLSPEVKPFDLKDGDANKITQYVREQFDFVYSSHCLEHMHEPRKAILEWWKLVRPGGHLFVIVPDEDLYEQGVFPSRFNEDHKATFTISKARSWSPVSVNVLDLVKLLPHAELVSVALHDHAYDRRLKMHGPAPDNWLARKLLRGYRSLKRRTGIGSQLLDMLACRYIPTDQTTNEVTLAQIQFIVKKLA